MIDLWMKRDNEGILLSCKMEINHHRMCELYSVIVTTLAIS
jgi:hypothetical protein